MLSFKNLSGLVILSFCLFIVSCGKAQVHEVTPLSDTQKKIVLQNLNNGEIPGPQAVKNGTLAPVDDACAKFKAKIPTDFTQALIEVPEDPSDPSGKKIHVFYYGKIIPGKTPVVFFNGGPASSSHGSYEDFTPTLYRLDPNHDVGMIYIDQRGTGCSDYYPQMADSKNPDATILERLTHYGTTGIVSDAEYIRKQLIGDQPWIAFGQSYGAFIAHRYAASVPTSLKAVFAHANTINMDGYTRLKNRILSQARVMEIYFKQYPDDRAALNLLHASIGISVCFKDTGSTDEACGYSDIAGVFSDNFLGFNDTWPKMHAWINTLVSDGKIRNDGIALLLNTFYFQAGNVLNKTGWAEKVIAFVDRNVPPSDAPNCTKIKTDLLAEDGVDLDKVAIHECQWALSRVSADPASATVDSYAAVRGLKQDLLTLSEFSAALKANASLAFYLYSGLKDPYVPVEEFGEELAAVKDLPNLHYHEFTGTGHDGYYSEPKVWLDLVSEIKR